MKQLLLALSILLSIPSFGQVSTFKTGIVDSIQTATTARSITPGIVGRGINRLADLVADKVDSVWRRNDTVFIIKEGVSYFAFKDSSASFAYTPENVANKSNDSSLVGTSGQYPTNRAVLQHVENRWINTLAALALKEPTITPGTTSQYYRGDKTWQTLNTSAISGLSTGFIQNQFAALQTASYAITGTAAASLFGVYSGGVAGSNRYAYMYRNIDEGRIVIVNQVSGNTLHLAPDSIHYIPGGGGSTTLKFVTPTDVRRITFPDASGTVALEASVWSLSGNAATAGSLAGSFLGTTNAVSLRFRTNNTERMIIDSVGKVGVGISAPTARLHLPAGTATAGTAPLKIPAGTNLTAVEDGAMEYNGTHLYFTVGSTRYQLDQQGGSGVTTMAPIGSSPNANGASISASNLTLQPASESFGGVLTTGTQSIAGLKKHVNDLEVEVNYSKLILSEPGRTEKANVQMIEGSVQFSGNTYFDGAAWQKYNSALPAWNLYLTPDGNDRLTVRRSATGGTVTWVDLFTVRPTGIINTPLIPEYANEAAAVAAGLVVGDWYQTGNDLKIVD